MAKPDYESGGIGLGLGGVFGGLLGLFGNKKKKQKLKKLSTLDPTQQKLYDLNAQGLQGQGQFADLYNFDENAARNNFQQSYAQPAYQNYQENIIPGITGSFRGGNLQNSSYLGGALAKSGADVQRGLDAQLADMLYKGQQASIDRRTQGVNNLLNMQTFAYQKPDNQPGLFEQAIGGFANGAGKAAATYAMGG